MIPLGTGQMAVNIDGASVAGHSRGRLRGARSCPILNRRKVHMTGKI